MTTKLIIPNAKNPLLLLGEGLGRCAEPVEAMRSGQFLKAAAVSTEKAIEMMKLTKRQIEVIMFVAGVGTLEGLALSLVEG